ncbi:MAG: hypothetical protein KBC72_00570 [Acinetobacter sp.]|nr:hypothetical protein [Acinetobacter sp.]
MALINLKIYYFTQDYLTQNNIFYEAGSVYTHASISRAVLNPHLYSKNVVGTEPLLASGVLAICFKQFDDLKEAAKINFKSGMSYIVNNEILSDELFEQRLMSHQFLMKKKYEELIAQNNTALDADDLLTVLKNKKAISNLANLTSADLFTFALAGLDARVAKGEPDKPVIRQKLIDKISGATPDMQPTLNGGR